MPGNRRRRASMWDFDIASDLPARAGGARLRVPSLTMAGGRSKVRQLLRELLDTHASRDQSPFGLPGAKSSSSGSSRFISGDLIIT
jgi:hypothetical protein